MRVRAIRRSDAGQMGGLIKDFADYLRSLGDKTDFRFDSEAFLRDGFGRKRAFNGVVAESAGEIAGYLLYHFGYDTDRGERILHVVDLYVRPQCRRQGIGRALMQRATDVCKDAGGKSLFWSVYAPNAIARGFYRRLGARYTQDTLYMRMRVK